MTHSQWLGSDKHTVHRTIRRVIGNTSLSAANSITWFFGREWNNCGRLPERVWVAAVSIGR